MFIKGRLAKDGIMYICHQHLRGFGNIPFLLVNVDVCGVEDNDCMREHWLVK